MKNYKVVLRDVGSEQMSSGDSAEPASWLYGVVAPQAEGPRVRLARVMPDLGGWEFPWAKFVSLGVAVASVMSGSLTGEAQASTAPHLALPQAAQIKANLWVTGKDESCRDRSESALQVLQVLREEQVEGNLVASTPHSNSPSTGEHTNTTPHSNSSKWDNHNNSGGSGTGNNWDNHVNTNQGSGQFQHTNSVGGDFIF